MGAAIGDLCNLQQPHKIAPGLQRYWLLFLESFSRLGGYIVCSNFSFTTRAFNVS